jgi:hypothetical protein
MKVFVQKDGTAFEVYCNADAPGQDVNERCALTSKWAFYGGGDEFAPRAGFKRLCQERGWDRFSIVTSAHRG